MAVDTTTLQSAIHSENGFSQIQTPGEKAQVPVGSVDEPTIIVITNTEPHPRPTTTLQRVMREMKRMVKQMELLRENHQLRQPTGSRGDPNCKDCQTKHP